MTKSEVLKILSAQVYECIYNNSGYTCESIAKDMLACIESVGMLPPEGFVVKEINHRTDHWGSTELLPTKVSIGNKWESE